MQQGKKAGLFTALSGLYCLYYKRHYGLLKGAGASAFSAYGFEHWILSAFQRSTLNGKLGDVYCRSTASFFPAACILKGAAQGRDRPLAAIFLSGEMLLRSLKPVTFLLVFRRLQSIMEGGGTVKHFKSHTTELARFLVFCAFSQKRLQLGCAVFPALPGVHSPR